MKDKHQFTKKTKDEIENIKKERENVCKAQNPISKKLKIVECPRDAMQGLLPFIPTKKKAAYINSLLKVGFDTIDVGSFVSPKAIPQLKDTGEVLGMLEMDSTTTKLLAIIGNVRGGNDAASYNQISYLGFPFSASPTFLERNLSSTVDKSLSTIEELLKICTKHKKELVVYISMGFGNPYGDDWSVDITAKWTQKLIEMGVKIIALSDTIGVSNVQSISNLFATLVPAFPDIEFGFHLHTSIRHWYRKVNAAYENGCRRFDSVINGLGGCPLVEEGQLVGNLKTSNLLEFLEIKKVPTGIDEEAFLKAVLKSLRTFPTASFFGSGEQSDND